MLWLSELSCGQVVRCKRSNAYGRQAAQDEGVGGGGGGERGPEDAWHQFHPLLSCAEVCLYVALASCYNFKRADP